MPPSQEKKDLVTLNALEYLVKNQHGYIDDLKKNQNFNDTMIGEFYSLGFIKTGWTRGGKKTYRALPFVATFFEVVR